MKNNKKYYVIIWLLLVSVFNVICFVTPNQIGGESKFDNSFWIGYAFIMASFVLHLAFSLYAFSEANSELRPLNMPLQVISYIELVLMVFVGSLCMMIDSIPDWLGAIICYVIMAFSVILLISVKATAMKSSESNRTLNIASRRFRDMTDKAQSLVSAAKTAETKKMAQSVYEAVRYSDPMSSEATVFDETEIGEKLDKLYFAFSSDENLESIRSKADELKALIERRNSKCKSAKRKVQ